MNTELKRRATRKHFRYLSKQDVLDPIKYLNDFFKHQSEITFWCLEVKLLLLYGLDGTLKKRGRSCGSTAQKLIKHIEIAYILYKVANIKETTVYKKNVKYIADIHNLINQYKDKHTVKEILFLFFEYKSLKDWRSQIDEILSNASVPLKTHHSPISINSLLIYHHLYSLINALHQIHLEGGLALEIPNFIYKKEVE